MISGSVPSLTRLSINCKTDENNKRSTKRQKRINLVVAHTQERLGTARAASMLNVGCVSAVEMIVAKATLDALVLSNALKRPSAFLDHLRDFHQKHIQDMVYTLRDFKGEIARLCNSDTSVSSDLLKWNTIINLCDHNSKRLDETKGKEYRSFLVAYAEERGVSEERLLKIDMERDSDSETEDERPFGTYYSTGINRILTEYFGSIPHYGTSNFFKHTIRAFAENQHGHRVCVGIIMMSDTIPNSSHTLLSPDADFSKSDAFRIQGIVSCAIFRFFHHAPVGNVFLEYVQRLAEETNRVVLVNPTDNEKWKEKLRGAHRVHIWRNS
jgi:hypothetical protein